MDKTFILYRCLHAGPLSAAKQREFEKHCQGKDLSGCAVYHTVERTLA